VREFRRLLKLLGHPLRLDIVLMLLKRDHFVCEFFYVFEDPLNLISYILKNSKKVGLSNYIIARTIRSTN